MKKTTSLALFLAVTLAAASLVVIAQRLAERPHDRPVEPRAVTPRGPLLESEKSLVALFEQAAPSVAYITTERLERSG